MTTTLAAITGDDVRANETVTAEFESAFRAKAWDRVSELYTEDGYLMPPNQPPVRGRAEIRAFLQAFPPVSAFALSADQVDGRGDLAFVRGSYRMTLTPPGASGPVQDEGKYLEIRRRGTDGRWRIAVDIFNSNKPA
jgi:uncharacterized protein (TIGR02246 family)